MITHLITSFLLVEFYLLIFKYLTNELSCSLIDIRVYVQSEGRYKEVWNFHLKLSRTINKVHQRKTVTNKEFGYCST
jgi:hypothetical protein